MLPDWYRDFSQWSGPSFVPAWSSADVACVALVAFTVFFILGVVLLTEWPTDVAFFALVAAGLLANWPTMIAMTLAAVFLVMLVSGVHAVVTPMRMARIES